MPPVPVVGIVGIDGPVGVVDITSGTAFIGEGAVRTAGADGAVTIGAATEGAVTTAANADELSENSKSPKMKNFIILNRFKKNHLIKIKIIFGHGVHFYKTLVKHVLKNASDFVITFTVCTLVISAVVDNHFLDVLLQEDRPELAHESFRSSDNAAVAS